MKEIVLYLLVAFVVMALLAICWVYCVQEGGLWRKEEVT